MRFRAGKLYQVDVKVGDFVGLFFYTNPYAGKYVERRYVHDDGEMVLGNGEIMMYLYRRKTGYGLKPAFLYREKIIVWVGTDDVKQYIREIK